jgi:hypothetical protein
MLIKKIFKKKIAIELMIKKHNLVYTEPNRLKPWLSVFCFQETDSLLQDLTKITNRNN